MATTAPVGGATADREPLRNLEKQGIKTAGIVHWNYVPPLLVEAAVRRGEGRLADMGPFTAVTSPHTGRSPKDKFVVRGAVTANDVDWGTVNQPFDPAKFATLSADVRHYLSGLPELFVQDRRDRSARASDDFSG